jgi:hypothetical protein
MTEVEIEIEIEDEDERVWLKIPRLHSTRHTAHGAWRMAHGIFFIHNY